MNSTTAPAAVRTPRAHLTLKERALLGARGAVQYDRGASIRAIAEETGYSYGTVHRYLKLAGVVMRPRGGGVGSRTRAGAGR
ncbi:helix-turn-helix domain-containing protein (plasmid) [Streptomyces sp. BI20]|uniref:helix-turn-helix domain-containing protein n=1 Tax=Streptomyces sp. BI20 TaxID=3403460 RepID=UPI003C78B296